MRPCRAGWLLAGCLLLLPCPFQGHSNSVFALAYSRDGALLATASLDGTALVWDAKRPAVQPGKQAAPPLTAEQLEAQWKALGSDAASEGYRAILLLSS